MAMGMPSINIIFRTAASTALRRSQRGIVGVILKDSADGTAGAHIMLDSSKIPTTLSEVNQDYLEKTFLGYVRKPKKVIAYVIATDAKDVSEALTYFATQKINYIVGPPDCTADEAQAIATWIKAQRANKRNYKAVLPNTAADCEGIINFATSGITIDKKNYTTAEYCGRIAGIIAGTPISIACTYAPLPEVTDVTRLTEEEMDAAVDAGKFIIFHDGEKVKAGRAVNSLQTITSDKGDAFKKIKIVDAVDMMQDDIRLLVQDNYIGKYPNSYDNKCLLITAIQDYFAGLEKEEVLSAGKSTVGIDIDRTKKYLADEGKDISTMKDNDVKTADTGTNVFLSGMVCVLDTIEDISLDMSMVE